MNIRLKLMTLTVAAACVACLMAVDFATAQCGDPSCTDCAQSVTMAGAYGHPAPAIIECGGCSKPGCLSCLRSRRMARRACDSCNTDCGCTQCPSCEGDICKLELDNSKVKKSCFKVEQKTICVPPIRFPWMTNCPPGTSKTRVVSKLTKHSYECPNCSYKWTLQKPEQTEAPKAAAPSIIEPTPVKDSFVPPAPPTSNQVPPPSARYQVYPQQDSPKYYVAPRNRNQPWLSSAPVTRK